MQVRLLAADDPLELGDPRRGLDELVGAPRGGRAGVRGRRLGRRGERGRRRPPADLAAALAVKPGCPTRPIDLEPIVKQLARHPALARNPRDRRAPFKPRDKIDLELRGKNPWRCFRHAFPFGSHVTLLAVSQLRGPLQTCNSQAQASSVTVVAREGPQGSPPAWIVPYITVIYVSFRIPSKRFLLASKRFVLTSFCFALFRFISF